MLTVARSEFGTAAWCRMVREGVVLRTVCGVGTPADVPDEPWIRTLIVSTHVPDGFEPAGLAALWIATGGSAPRVVDVVGPRGRRWRNTTHPVTGARIIVHGLTRARGTSADVGTACMDALRWSRLEDAIPAVWRALSIRSVSVRDVAKAARALDEHAATTARAMAAWDALSIAWTTRVGAHP